MIDPQKLSPLQWLKKIDKYLLLNERVLWETRILYLGTYLVISYLILFAGSIYYPISLTEHVPETEFVTSSLLILNSIILIFWIYKNSFFSIERGFGIDSAFIEQGRFLIYFGGIALLGFQIMLPSKIIKKRVANVLSEQELIADLQDLNEGNIFFPSSNKSGSLYPDNIYDIKNFGDVYYPIRFFGKEELVYESFPSSKSFDVEDCISTYDFPQTIEETRDYRKAIFKINAFKDTYNKYALEKLTTSSKVIYEVFQRGQLKGGVGYKEIGDQLDKKWVKNRIMTFKNAKVRYALKAKDRTNEALIMLLGAFMLTIFVQAGKHVGLKTAILGGAFGIGLLIAVFLLSTLIGLPAIAPLLLFLFLTSQSGVILSLESYSSLSAFSLMGVQVFSPFVLLYFSLLFGSKIDSIDEVINILLVTCVLYVVFLVPIFRKLHLRLRALPRN